MKDTGNMDTLGTTLAMGSLKALVRLYPAIRDATEAQQEMACAAMRVKSREVVDQVLDDIRAAPWLTKPSLQWAILTMASEGIRVLKAEGVGVKTV